MRTLIYPLQGCRDSLGLLAVRIVMGAAFLFHGWPKINNPMAWMGDAVPGFLQAAAAVTEFGGGILLLIGLLARPAAFFMAATMATAAYMGHISKGDPFVGKPGAPSWELAAVYFACSLLILCSGAGKFSLDAALFARRDADAELS